MKKIYLLLCFAAISQLVKAQTWEEWFQQDKTQIQYLKEQIVKLQFYLSYVKKGYNIVNKGLNTIGDIKTGDFHLHEDFFTSLQTVSPGVKNYARIADMVALQKQMLATYRKYDTKFREAGVYSSTELRFLDNLLNSVLDEARQDVESMLLVVSNGKLEMNENERMSRIDHLYASLSDRYLFLLSFCKKAEAHFMQRQRELAELNHLQKRY
jgi:hypothetical protein